jgi:putative phage-type endonuclease
MPEIREITSTQDWLAWRREDITASRLPALFGVHPFLSRDDLAAELAGTAHRPPNSAMRRGRILEPAVAAAIAEDRPDWRITKATTYHRLPDVRLGATPDFWLDDDGLIQAKTVSPEKWEEWHGKPPLAYTLQTLAELIVTERRRGILAVMVCSPSYPVHLYPVPRHPAAEARIITAISEWWAAWERGEIAAPLPVPDIDDGSHVDLSGDNELPSLLAHRMELKRAASDVEKSLAGIDAAIKAKLGKARTAWLPGWQISWATQHRRQSVIPAMDMRVLRVKPNVEQAL